MLWQTLNQSQITNHKSLITVLLKNRNLKTKKEIDDFLNPKDPRDIKIQELGIKNKDLKIVINRLNRAKKRKERIVIFGDYDADGVCATAILWETMYKMGYDVMPYIPDRFEEGYGIKYTSFENENFKKLNPSLVITVDNGIVAYDAVKKSKNLGIDVIVVDHHAKGNKKLNTKYIIHNTNVCGSALSWFLSEALVKVGPSKQIIKRSDLNISLDLAIIGTIADQMPLLGINRSIVKFGLDELNNTKKIGLKELFKQAGITNIGVYEIGFIIAPRINAMGRLSKAIDSLRLLCTRNKEKAVELAETLNQTNLERQKIVEDVLKRTLTEVDEKQKIIVIHGEYHEGVIGLASGRVTERLYKPSIIISKGEKISKASARSIAGFNIMEAIKETGLILEGGGHPMAAGFSIETTKIDLFIQKINALSDKLLTEELLQRNLKIDVNLDFEIIDSELINLIKKFEPFGNGNYAPVFETKSVKIAEIKKVGSDGKHLKLKLEKDKKTIDAIAFGMAQKELVKGSVIDIAYSVEENVWNNKTSIQLKVKDISILP